MVFQLYFQLQLMSSSGVYVCLLVMSNLERLMVPWQNIQQHSGYEVSVFQAWTDSELKIHRVPQGKVRGKWIFYQSQGILKLVNEIWKRSKGQGKSQGIL